MYTALTCVCPGDVLSQVAPEGHLQCTLAVNSSPGVPPLCVQAEAPELHRVSWSSVSAEQRWPARQSTALAAPGLCMPAGVALHHTMGTEVDFGVLLGSPGLWTGLPALCFSPMTLDSAPTGGRTAQPASTLLVDTVPNLPAPPACSSKHTAL